MKFALVPKDLVETADAAAKEATSGSGGSGSASASASAEGESAPMDI